MKPRTDDYHAKDAVHCPTCRGRSRVPCAWCGGDGCGECDDGSVPCEDCDGAGMMSAGMAERVGEEG